MKCVVTRILWILAILNTTMTTNSTTAGLSASTLKTTGNITMSTVSNATEHAEIVTMTNNNSTSMSNITTTKTTLITTTSNTIFSQPTTKITKIANQMTLTENSTYTTNTEASTKSSHKDGTESSLKMIEPTTTKSSASELPTTSNLENISTTTSEYMTAAQNASTKTIIEISTAMTDRTNIVTVPTMPDRTTTDELSTDESSTVKTTAVESTTKVFLPSINDSTTIEETSVTTDSTDTIPSTRIIEGTISTPAVADSTTTEDASATNKNTMTGLSMTTKNTTTLSVRVSETTTNTEYLTTWYQNTTSEPAKSTTDNSTSVEVMSTVESTPVETSVLTEYTPWKNNSDTTPESNITESLTTKSDSGTTVDEGTTVQPVPTTINSSISVELTTTIKGTSIKSSGLTEYTTNQTNKALKNYTTASPTTTAESFTTVDGSTMTKLFTTRLMDSSATTELFTTSPRISQTTLTTGNTTNATLPETTTTIEPLTTELLKTTRTVVSTTEITTMQPMLITLKEFYINVSIDSSPIIEGRHAEMLKCNYLRNDTGKEPTMTWTKDNINVSNSNIPFLTTNQTCVSSTCISTLTFQDINILIEGTYKCIVRETIPGVLFKGEASIEVKVKQTPALVIKPIRSSVQENASVTVNCYVSNKGEAYLKNNATLNICFANNNTKVPGCSGINLYNVTCKLTLVTNTSVICGLGNCTHISQSSYFTVVKTGAELCSTDGEWPTTLVGNEASIPCPDGYSGTKTRKCQPVKSWASEVNTDDCKQKELEKLENILNITTEITEATVDLSLSSISNIVNKSTSFSNNADVVHNDILQSVNLISQISSKNVSFNNSDAANKTTQVFMGVVSTLLDTGKDHVNAKSKSMEKEVTSKILSSINNFAKSVTGALKVNQSVTVQKPNMLVSIEKIPKGTDITFPKEGNKDPTTHFKLPQSALKSLSDDGVSFTAVKYDNLGSEFISKTNTAIDSSVLSLTVDNLNSNNLQDNISLTFHRKNGTESPPECVFLSQSHDVISAWNTSGCSVENFTNSQVFCTCNHLTNFAILLSLPDEVEVKTLAGHLKALTLITFIGCSLSIIGALATIFIYLYFWRHLKSRRSVLVINLCMALFVAYLLFLTAVEQTNNKTGCVVIAALLHYFFLAMFCIMLALGIDLAVAVLDVFNSRSSSALLLLLSWGLPALIVGITLGATQTSGYGDESYCWLRHTTLFGFIGPALGILLANLIIVIIIMRTIYSSSFMLKKSTKEKAASGLRSICSLLPILGLTWVFGVLSIGDAAIIFQYLFAICNSLQGLFIFLFHVVLNTQVRQAVSRKIKQYESKTLSTTSTSKRNLVSSKKISQDEHTIEENTVSGSTSFVLPRINTGVSRRQGLFIS